MTTIHALLQNPIVRGAVSGMGAAAVVDIHAFLGWKKIQDGLSYDYGTAVLRWTQGALTGALAGMGFGAFT